MIKSSGPAAYYDDLTLSLAEAKAMLENGAQNRRKAAHTPVVATIDPSGAPAQRVLILRHVDWQQRTLRFHTDNRSAKVSEADGAPVSVLIYDPDAKVQLRLSGTGRIERFGAAADSSWAESTLFARRCYMSQMAPASLADKPVSGLPEWIEGKQPTDADIAAARENFAILMVQFHNVEWLYLANNGHRRARWIWQDGWQGSWLIP